MKNIFKILILIFILLTVFSDASAMGRQYTNKISLNKEASDFNLYDLDGKKVTLLDFKNKNNVILFFWATWCAFCRKEIAQLDKIHDELKTKEIIVLGISVDESSKDIKSFIGDNPIKFTTLLDKDALVSSDYGIIGIPTYIFINKAGIIEYIEHEFPENYETLFSQ